MFSDVAALDIDTPAVVIDAAIMKRNIERVAALTGRTGVALRPHTKTHKMVPIAHMQVAAGAQGITVAKLGEAAVMIDGGIEDILVAYPIVGERKVARLIQLAERARITVALDSEDCAAAIGRAAHARGLTIRVLVEVDTGLRRCGVPPREGALELARRVALIDGVELAGIMTHEGHAYAARDTDDLERITLAAARDMVETAELIRAAGLPVDTVTVGAAGTVRFTAGYPGLTEVRPGTYVFNDRTQVALGAAGPDDCAAVIVATVVSTAHEQQVILDCGTKSLTSDPMLVYNPRKSYGAVQGHDDWEIVRVSEEHGILQVPPEARLRLGDRVCIVPNHVCPTINLAEQVTLVDGGTVVDRWPVNGRGKVQ